jgi:hypothetical protein
MNNLILGYKRGYYRCLAIQTALAKFQQKSTIITDEDDFEKIEGNYDRIFTMSESLLPLQYKLEQQLGINNLTKESVEILTNKFKMDEYARSLGFTITPKSVLPENAEDLNVFRDKPVFVKPVVGSGTKDQHHNFPYTAFKNKDELLKRVSFNTWIDKDFNNMQNQLMVQEHLPDNSEIYALYAYANSSGRVTPLYWSKGSIMVKNKTEMHWQPRNYSFEGIPTNEVPGKIKHTGTYFYQKLVDGLKIKNLLMVADFYYFDDTVKFIDLNPRIGQGMVMYDDLCDNEFLPNVFAEMPLPEFKRHLWKETKLKPGTIKSVGDYKSVEGAGLASNFHLHDNVVIPEEYFLSSQDFHFSLFVSGKEKTDMYETYRSSHNQLQACIEYY